MFKSAKIPYKIFYTQKTPNSVASKNKQVLGQGFASITFGSKNDKT